MTDAEIDALARELLTEAIHNIFGWNPEFFSEVLRLPDGELIPVYSARSEEGYGMFLCELRPLEAIKTIIVESEKIYDEFILSMDSKPLTDHNRQMIKSALNTGRDRTLRHMARQSAMQLITYFHTRLLDTLEEAVEDSKIIAEGFIAISLAKSLDKYAPEPVKVDARKAIDHAAERVAKKKRKALTEQIKGLPHLVTHRGRGAPRKSKTTRDRERQAYTEKVRDAYRKLRIAAGQKPTKTSVGKELNEGGISPKTFEDSSLWAFRAKLKRLDLDYDAIVREVENELNKKP
jgi:ribonuclease HII